MQICSPACSSIQVKFFEKMFAGNVFFIEITIKEIGKTDGPTSSLMYDENFCSRHSRVIRGKRAPRRLSFYSLITEKDRKICCVLSLLPLRTAGGEARQRRNSSRDHAEWEKDGEVR